MANAAFLHTAILFQNAEKTITLLDIPTSISLAQGTLEQPCMDQIYSSPALKAPYPSIEPKSEKARANVLRTKRPSETDIDFPVDLLKHSLSIIAESWQESWCLPRKVSPLGSERQNRKRKAVGSEQQTQAVAEKGQEPQNINRASIPEVLTLSAMVQPILSQQGCFIRGNIYNRLIRNELPNAVSLKQQNDQQTFRIPPHSAFLQSKIDRAKAIAFSMAALTVYPNASATAGPAQFDFILLDPPWGNRSVRRSAEYKTMQEPEPMEVLEDNLGQHMAVNALVACWITNNSSVRKAALEAFLAWDVQLIEEWAWLKTTVAGEPVTEINGVWRKPYEILLIGKRKSSGHFNIEAGVLHKVIVAVPDLHSRKPNLKELIKPLVPRDCRGLEVFARNLTAGWWAWGDEATKYNWEGHWPEAMNHNLP